MMEVRMLYVVATPLGHLGDMSTRMLEILQSVDIIIAEHPDHTQKLLPGIKKKWIKIQDPIEIRVANRVVKGLHEGLSFALVSDAGTPLISDPGYRVVRAVIEAGFRVVPIPGPSAVITALSVSGLPVHHFYFAGFLSAQKGARSKQIQALAKREETSVIYESPKRCVQTIEEMQHWMEAERSLVLCRELTKQYETILYATVGSILDVLAQPLKGECVLVVGGHQQGVEITAQVRDLLRHMVPKWGKKAAIEVAVVTFGVKKNDCYRWIEAHFP